MTYTNIVMCRGQGSRKRADHCAMPDALQSIRVQHVRYEGLGERMRLQHRLRHRVGRDDAEGLAGVEAFARRVFLGIPRRSEEPVFGEPTRNLRQRPSRRGGRRLASARAGVRSDGETERARLRSEAMAT